jgi:DHA2 family multidrug resistance protein
VPTAAGQANKWLITITVMTGTIMAALDLSIVNVALPYMRGSLSASVEEITWVATGYTLSNVIVMPLIAFLSGRFGRKRFYMFSVLLFTGASMACGMAKTLSTMILFRAVQGVGGGALIPVSQAILRETFPEEQQGTAMGIYGLGVILGPAIGPTLGGWLTDRYSWPWIFYVNVPIGIVNLLLVSRFIQDPPYLVRQKGKVDVLGIGLLAVGLGSLQIMLEKGEQKDWFTSQYIMDLAGVAAVGLLLFVLRELMTKRPAVDLRILKDPTFTAGTMIGGIFGTALFGTLFLMPLLLEQLLGYPAFDAGLTLMPRSLAMAATMPIVGRIYDKTGPRALVFFGLLVSAFTYWKLSRLSLDIGFWDIVFPLAMQGVGFGSIFVPLTTVALTNIEKPKMQAATGLYNVVRLVCGSIGIALATTLLDRGSATAQSGIITTLITPFRDVTLEFQDFLTQAMIANGSDPYTAQAQALEILNREIGRQSMIISFNRIFFLVAVLFMLCLPLILLLKSVKVRDN